MTEHDPFQHLLDEARADEAVDARIRERLLRQVAEGSARLRGVLADLVEQHPVVTVRCASGNQHQGRLRDVASDHVVVRNRDGLDVHIALDEIVLVRPEPSLRFPAATGDRDVPTGRTLHEVLAWVVGDRPRIAVVARGGGAPIAADLRAVGEDVATLVLDGSGDIAYLATAAIAELTILDT